MENWTLIYPLSPTLPLIFPVEFYLFIYLVMACRILVPRPGTELKSWQWKHKILTTRPQGNSLQWNFKNGIWEVFPANSSIIHSFTQSSHVYWVSINHCDVICGDTENWILLYWFSLIIMQRCQGPGGRFPFKLWSYLLYINILLTHRVTWMPASWTKHQKGTLTSRSVKTKNRSRMEGEGRQTDRHQRATATGPWHGCVDGHW